MASSNSMFRAQDALKLSVKRLRKLYVPDKVSSPYIIEVLTQPQVFTFRIQDSQAGCLGESGLVIPGERITAPPSTSLQIEEDVGIEGARGQWSMSCICLKSENGRPCPSEDYARVLMFDFPSVGQHPHPGFTVIYKQFNKPEILQVTLDPEVSALERLVASKHWQNPSMLAYSDATMQEVELYHSAVLEQSFTSTTGSNLPMPSHKVISAPKRMTLSALLHEATLLPEGNPTFRLVSGQAVPEPTAAPNTDNAFQSNDPMTIIEQVFEIVESKAKNLANAGINVHHNLDGAQRFLSSPPQAASRVESVPQLDELEDLYEFGAPEEPVTVPSSSDITPEPTTPHDLTITAGSPISMLSSSLNGTIRTDQAIRAFQITCLIVILVSFLTAIFIVLFCNPRRRADRRAQREERRRRRLYRKAARQHKWRSWFARLRGSQSPNPTSTIKSAWQEKQARAIEEEASPIISVRAELRALRTAHEVVDSMVNAEEGRTEGAVSASQISMMERRMGRFFRSNSQSSGPPSYEESVTAVDGFQYTMSGTSLTRTGTDCTPDSSVIDTSPRTSVYMGASDSEKE